MIGALSHFTLPQIVALWFLAETFGGLLILATRMTERRMSATAIGAAESALLGLACWTGNHTLAVAVLVWCLLSIPAAIVIGLLIGTVRAVRAAR